MTRTASPIFSELRPVVDFPQPGETITGPNYSIRLSAPETAQKVEISINQGHWQECRPAAGFWWYDWSDYRPGDYELVARVTLQDGRKRLCDPHEFNVRFAGERPDYLSN